MKTAIASLEERLSDWTSKIKVMYEIGACLGLWPEAGAPPGEDPFHGIRSELDSMAFIITGLCTAQILEWRDSHDGSQKRREYRFNPDFQNILNKSVRKEELKAFW